MTTRQSNDSMINGAVLVGGASRRMGRPKAGLQYHDRTFLQTSVDLLSPFVRNLALVGRLPVGICVSGIEQSIMKPIVRIEDDPQVYGPLAGIAASLAWDDAATWLFVPCDMPGMTRDAIQWLLGEYHDSATATIGMRTGPHHIEPLPLIIGPNTGDRLQCFIRSGGDSIRHAMQFIGARTVRIPNRFIDCWQNVNTPQDFTRLFDGAHLPHNH